MPFSTPSAAGHECHLSTCKYRRITPNNRGEYIRLALSYRYTQLHTTGSRSYPRPQLQSVTHNRVKVIPSPSATLSYTQQGQGHTLALSYTQLHTTGSWSYPRPQLQVHSVTHPTGSRSYPRPQLQVHSVTHNRVKVIPLPSATGTLSYTQQGRGHTLALSYRYTQLQRGQGHTRALSYRYTQLQQGQGHTLALSYRYTKLQQGQGQTLALSYRYTQLHTTGSRSDPCP